MKPDDMAVAAQGSERVRRVASAAIRLVCAQVLKHDISEDEARDLAVCYSPSQSVDALKRQLQVRRTTSSGLLGETEQRKLATELIIIEGKPPVTIAGLQKAAPEAGTNLSAPAEKHRSFLKRTARADFLKKKMESYEEQERRVAVDRRIHDKNLELSRRMGTYGGPSRSFYRKMYRLYAQQRLSIYQNILESGLRDALFIELEEIYGSYGRKAMKISEDYLRPESPGATQQD